MKLWLYTKSQVVLPQGGIKYIISAKKIFQKPILAKYENLSMVTATCEKEEKAVRDKTVPHKLCPRRLLKTVADSAIFQMLVTAPHLLNASA